MIEETSVHCRRLRERSCGDTVVLLKPVSSRLGKGGEKKENRLRKKKQCTTNACHAERTFDHVPPIFGFKGNLSLATEGGEEIQQGRRKSDQRATKVSKSSKYGIPETLSYDGGKRG